MTQAAARQNEDVYKYEILTSGRTKRFHIQYNPQKIDWHMPQAHTHIVTHTHTHTLSSHLKFPVTRSGNFN